MNIANPVWGPVRRAQLLAAAGRRAGSRGR